MAIREIRVVGDRVLTKKCRPVEEMTPRISELIDDMFDTMYEANGVGLAAPQVGILKRIVVIDVDGTPQLLARCICHECDHLDGHMYTEKVEGELWDNTYDEYEEYEDEE